MIAARRQSWKPIAAASAAAAAVAILGGTMTDLGPWYHSLRQPSWKPPDFAFGPAWTLIFALIAISGSTVWTELRDLSGRGWLLSLFAINGTLNILWSMLFFRIQRPDWALIEVGFLWLSIIILIAAVARSSMKAGALLLPYLAWVTFAAALNFEVVRLNAPF
jgi:tryptophan-rich sensory protein